MVTGNSARTFPKLRGRATNQIPSKYSPQTPQPQKTNNSPSFHHLPRNMSQVCTAYPRFWRLLNYALAAIRPFPHRTPVHDRRRRQRAL
jgi:hypothetical protein